MVINEDLAKEIGLNTTRCYQLVNVSQHFE